MYIYISISLSIYLYIYLSIYINRVGLSIAFLRELNIDKQWSIISNKAIVKLYRFIAEHSVS